MWIRNLATITVIIAASPALPIERLTPEEARAFIIGKWWEFTCPLVAPSGEGRVFEDGSADVRTDLFAWKLLLKPHYPAGTIDVQTLCVTGPLATLLPKSMKPCFTVEKIDDRSFQGRITSQPQLGFCKFLEK